MEPANVVGGDSNDLLGDWRGGVVALLGFRQKRRFVHQVAVGMVRLPTRNGYKTGSMK
jgi:hypothetical protein